jgi:hypothetical protein
MVIYCYVSNPGGWDGWDRYHEWGKLEMPAGYWLETPRFLPVSDIAFVFSL